MKQIWKMYFYIYIIRPGRRKEVRQELWKLFRSKMIFCLILISIIVNAYLFYMQKDKIETLYLIENFTRQNGTIVSKENMELLKEYWSTKNTSNISWEEFESNLCSAEDFYNTVQSGDMANAYCGSKQLQGEAAEYVRQEFQKFDERLDEATKQEITIFPPYRTYIFNFLAIYLLFAISMEGVFSAIILTLYLANFEKSNRTISTVYGTRRGKKVINDKLLASIAGTLVCFISIAIITVILLVLIFPTGTISGTLLSNPLVNLKGSPIITRASISIGMYVIASLGMSLALIVIYCLGSFAVAIKTKNSYYAFCIILMLSAVMKICSTMAPASTLAYFAAQYNPTDMLLKSGTWFISNSIVFSPPGYELCTAVLWFVICLSGCICGMYGIKKKEAMR